MIEPAVFQGAKLRIARLVNGWTKADLANHLQVSRQFIHALEVGEKPASQDMVAALALSLKVQPSFFFSPLMNEVKEEECHFRSRRSMPDKVADQVISFGTALELVVRFLDKHLELPPVNFPCIEVSNDTDIEKAARACREAWGLGSGPIANMVRVLENAGAVVTLYHGDRHELDALSMARARPLVIRNTLKQSPGRQRFDLAHECAHLVIHQGVSTGDELTESQANSFASAFLMPRESFVPEFPAMTGRLDWQAIYALKVRWRVSAKAIIRRAKDLGLIDDVQYAAGNRFLHSSGQARIEKFDDRIAFETPELLGVAVSAYIEGYSSSSVELAKQLGLSPGFLETLIGELPSRPTASLPSISNLAIDQI